MKRCKEPMQDRKGRSVGRPGFEFATLGILAALLLLKCGVLLFETKIWGREDPVLAGVPMWVSVSMAACLEAFVLAILWEETLEAEWKRLALAGLAVSFAAYRISGTILNGANLSGCECFGVLGRWLTGRESALLAWGLLAWFAYGAWRYGAGARKERAGTIGYAR